MMSIAPWTIVALDVLSISDGARRDTKVFLNHATRERGFQFAACNSRHNGELKHHIPVQSKCYFNIVL